MTRVEPTLHPCQADIGNDPPPRETWAPIDCVCIEPYTWSGYDIPTPRPTSETSLLQVDYPKYGDEITSPVTIVGRVANDVSWLRVSMSSNYGQAGYGYGAYQIGPSQAPQEFEIPFHFSVREPGLGCVTVYQTLGVGDVRFAGEVRIPVYVVPPQ